MPEKSTDIIQEVIQQSLPASCTIYVKDRKKSWSGSGFHIGKGLVCTASHVVPTGKTLEIHITFDKKIYFPCSPLVSDPNIDSAILKINSDWTKLAKVTLGNSDELQLGEVCAVIGSPELFHDTVTVGRISNIHQSLGDNSPSPSWNDVIIIDSKILPGVSGGMCVTTDGLVAGSIIGVMGEFANTGTGSNVVCPSNKIINLINSVR